MSRRKHLDEKRQSRLVHETEILMMRGKVALFYHLRTALESGHSYSRSDYRRLARRVQLLRRDPAVIWGMAKSRERALEKHRPQVSFQRRLQGAGVTYDGAEALCREVSRERDRTQAQAQALLSETVMLETERVTRRERRRLLRETEILMTKGLSSLINFLEEECKRASKAERQRLRSRLAELRALLAKERQHEHDELMNRLNAAVGIPRKYLFGDAR